MLAYVFGAYQLCGSHDYQPDSIHEEKALADSANYMYFGCIKFIKQQKQGVQFGASSPILNDISGVPEWSKVATGLFLMFHDEVLWSLQVMQHIKFGSLFNFNY